MDTLHEDLYTFFIISPLVLFEFEFFETGV